MIFSSSLLENSVNEFAKFPGIGKKTALRMVLHLLKKEVGDVKMFSDTILKMRQEIHFCSRCHNISDKEICNICADRSRKQDIICVVETIRDVIAIESTQQYNGLFHVLGGAEKLIVEAAVALQEKGYIVELFTSFHDPSHSFPETHDGRCNVAKLIF